MQLFLIIFQNMRIYNFIGLHDRRLYQYSLKSWCRNLIFSTHFWLRKLWLEVISLINQIVISSALSLNLFPLFLLKIHFPSYIMRPLLFRKKTFLKNVYSVKSGQWRVNETGRIPGISDYCQFNAPVNVGSMRSICLFLINTKSFIIHLK